MKTHITQTITYAGDVLTGNWTTAVADSAGASSPGSRTSSGPWAGHSTEESVSG